MRENGAGMTYDPEKHHRRSIRLGGYDYTQPGAYFVTVCTQDRECLFGEITDGEMRLNRAGQIVQKTWNSLPVRFPGILTDMFVAMPNHVHGIIMLGAAPDHPDSTAKPPVGARFIAPTSPLDCTSEAKGAINRAPTRKPPSLGEIIRTFKAGSTHRIRMAGFVRFAWQRNYYEHIIRTDKELDHIHRYIFDNPAQWALDQENPERALVGAHV
jgi:REP element-mobilizing transposase RayT